MGQKMLYIKEEDEIMFDEAIKSTGENFSAGIAKIVKHYLEFKNLETNGLRELTIKEGFKAHIPSNVTTIKEQRFIGRLLVEYRDSIEDSIDEYEYEYWKIFITRKRKIVIQKIAVAIEGDDYTYYILESLPFNGFLETVTLGPEDYYPDENGNLVTSEEIVIPRTLLLEAKKRLGETTSEFMDI